MTGATVEQTDSKRGSLLVESGKILAVNDFDGAQVVMRLQAEQIVSRALPGQFVHIDTGERWALRRPLSIMRIDRQRGWMELLFKCVGRGTADLARRAVGEQLSLIGPVGNGFQLNLDRPRPLLLGGGVGMPPMLFLADALRGQRHYQPLVLLASEVPFPFRPQPSTLMIEGMPSAAIATMPLLDDWGVPARLASTQGYPGCFDGYITDLASHWLTNLDSQERSRVELFACGPEPMLRAAAELAQEFELPSQLSLEEYMACAVGGCAGCVVSIREEDEVVMKRVCVDGPVFKGNQLVF